MTAAEAGSRDRILGAALALMSEHGVAGTSMRMLAGECGLNVATLYHHFPSKAELLAALLDERAYDVLLATAEPPAEVTGDGDAHVRLRRLVTWLWRSARDEEAVLRLLLGESMRGEPGARKAAEDLVDGIDGAVARWLGAVVPELGPGTPAVAGLVRSVLFGLITEHLALGPDEARERSRIAHLVTAVLPGPPRRP